MRTFLVATLAMLAVFGSQQAHAQFIGLSLDAAVDYTAAPDDVNGGTLGIVHPVPFFPNLGFTQVSFRDETLAVTNSVDLDSDVTIQSYHAYFNVPFPVVAVSVGAGIGTIEVESSLTGYSDKTKTTNPTIEGFFRIGLPFWNFIEFHIGYHAIMVGNKLDRGKSRESVLTALGSTVDTEKEYTGALTTVGLQLAF